MAILHSRKLEVTMHADETSAPITNRETFNRMQRGGTSKPLVLLKGVVDNDVIITTPKKYTIPRGLNHLECTNSDFPEHAVSINLVVADGYSCLVHAIDCEGLSVDIRPGFDNETILVQYKNPLLNAQAAKKVLDTWQSWDD